MVVEERKVLTVKDVSIITGNAEWTIRDWCRKGDIPHFRRGIGKKPRIFFYEDELFNWIEDQISQRSDTYTWDGE